MSSSGSNRLAQVKLTYCFRTQTYCAIEGMIPKCLDGRLIGECLPFIHLKTAQAPNQDTIKFLFFNISL